MPMHHDVVFLHGWLMGPELWSPQIDALGTRMRPFAVRQPGHGSPGLPGEASMPAWRQWLVAQLDERGIGRTVVVGHSMGGFLALELAAAEPERVAGLVLVGTSDEAWDAAGQTQFLAAVDQCAAGWNDGLADILGGLLFSERFRTERGDWLAAWSERVAQYDLSAVAHLGRAVAGRPDRSEASARIAVPTTVVHGTADQAMPPEAGRAMANRIGGAEFVEIDGAGHAPSVEAPDAFTAALTAHLDRMDTA